MSIEEMNPEEPTQEQVSAEPEQDQDQEQDQEQDQDLDQEQDQEQASARPDSEDAAAEPAPALPRVRLAEGATPTSEQMTATRAEHWHQDGKALLSLGDMREWLNRAGLVLYAPRTQQLPMPAPSFVEATLGKAAPTPDLTEMEVAKNLLTRLIADGAAVPLNLLGATGGLGSDTPDFVVSAAVFSYIFTLRGNKAWKQSPVTAGPVKVSPLALAAYEVLSAKVMLSVSDLTHELSSGVTESGVLRALTELWGQMRVIPVPQQDGSATLWELTTARFTKQIKAGANAGQPSALSALCSLYLGQAMLATEDEIETFLSPLAPRSRVRDVVHALTAARQLETVVVNGKSMLHVAGDTPAFTAAQVPAAEAEGGSRISTFTARPGSKITSGLRAKPAFGKKAYGSGRGDSAADSRERRPFNGSAGAGRSFGSSRDTDSSRGTGSARPQFNRPWDEDRKPQIAAASEVEQTNGEQAGSERPASEHTFRPRTDRPFSAKPRFNPAGSDRRSFNPKPRFEGRTEGFRGRDNSAGESRPPRREFTPREGFTPRSDGDAPRKTFSKPGTFGRKREGFAGSDERSPRRESGGAERSSGGGFKRPGSYSPRPQGGFGGSTGGFNGPKPGYARDSSSADQGSGGGEAPRKVFRKFDAPRDRKPGGSGKSFGAKPFNGGSRSDGERKTFTPGGSARPPRSFDGPRTSRPSFGGGDRPSFGGGARPSFGGNDRPGSSRPSFGGNDRSRSDRPASGGSDRPRGDRPAFGAKPGGFAAKKPFNKPGGFASKGGPFAKFADGAKPFRKPGEKRPPRPEYGGGGGGFAPSKRKREDE